MRLDKLVAERFGLSRRAAQDAVRNGRIDVQGTPCDEPGREVEPGIALAYFPSRPKARMVSWKGWPAGTGCWPTVPAATWTFWF